MEKSDIGKTLGDAHAGRYVVRIRAVNPAGNTIDIEGYVMAIGADGNIRVCQDDPQRGRVHNIASDRILGVERVHGA